MYDPEGKESEAVEERTVTNRVREIREHKLMTQSQLARKARIALLARREEITHPQAERAVSFALMQTAAMLNHLYTARFRDAGLARMGDPEIAAEIGSIRGRREPRQGSPTLMQLSRESALSWIRLILFGALVASEVSAQIPPEHPDGSGLYATAGVGVVNLESGTGVGVPLGLAVLSTRFRYCESHVAP